jgi:MFS transporter, ACS family, glucarate transporter
MNGHSDSLDAGSLHTHAPATRVRYGVLGFLCALAFILYLDRICISQAATDMEAELDISHTEMGFVLAAFTVAYGLFEIPTGRLGDRYGSRGVLTRIVIWWSVFTMLTGCVWKFSLDGGWHLRLPGMSWGVPVILNSFVVLLLIRFLFGAGEAGALPNTARVLARWFPATARGPAQGMINTAALLGGAVAPIAAQALIRAAGWRWTFLCFGSLGVVWAAAFYNWFRDDPAAHPGVNDAERRRIGAGSGLRQLTHEAIPWRAVLTSANVWLAGMVITCSAFCTYLYFSWYPTYLKKARGVGDQEAGLLAGMVLLGGAVGGTLGGYLSDWLVRRTGSRRWGRRLIGVVALASAGLALGLSVRCNVPVEAALLTALASFCANLHLASWWGVVTDISGKHVGALFGLMNSLGVPGAVASQIYIGRFADWRMSLGYTGRDAWDPGLFAYVVVPVIGAIGWLFLDATKPVVREAKLSDGGAIAETVP